MFDALSIPTSELPDDVVGLISTISKIQDAECTVTFTAKELGTLGNAVGGLRNALTRGLRTAPSEEAANAMVDLLTEATNIGRRIESTIHGLFVAELGPDYGTSEVAQKLNALIDAQTAAAHAQHAPAGNTVVERDRDGAYL